jgi:hypothetical protein
MRRALGERRLLGGGRRLRAEEVEYTAGTTRKDSMYAYCIIWEDTTPSSRGAICACMIMKSLSKFGSRRLDCTTTGGLEFIHVGVLILRGKFRIRSEHDEVEIICILTTCI